jgi:hypothetical protein
VPQRRSGQEEARQRMEGGEGGCMVVSGNRRCPSDSEIGCSDMTCGKPHQPFHASEPFFLVMAINQILGYCGASLESWRGGLQLCTRASMPGPLFHGRPWGWLLHLGVVGICGHVGVCLGTDLVRPSPTGEKLCRRRLWTRAGQQRHGG